MVELPYHYANFFQHMVYMLNAHEDSITKYLNIREHRGPFLGDWFFDSSISGGMINDKVIHFFDMALALFYPAMPKWVFANASQHTYKDGMKIKQLTEKEVEIDKVDIADNSQIIVGFDDDKVLNIGVVMYQNDPIEGLSIETTSLDGTFIKLNGLGSDFVFHTSEKSFSITDKSDNDKNEINHPGAKQLFREFYNSIENRTIPQSNVWASYISQLVTFASIKSIEEDRKVYLDELNNKSLDQQAISQGYITKPIGKEFEVIDESDSYHDNPKSPLWRRLAIRRKGKFTNSKKITIKDIKKIANQIEKDTKIQHEIKEINAVIEISFPWETICIEFSDGKIIPSKGKTKEPENTIHLSLTDKGYDAVISGKSIVRQYIQKEVQVQEDISQIIKHKKLFLKLIELIREELN